LPSGAATSTSTAARQPAFLYLNRRHAAVEPLLAGWWGTTRTASFDMNPQFCPVPGARGFQISTPGILSAAPISGALAVLAEAASGGSGKNPAPDELPHALGGPAPAPERYRVRIGTRGKPAVVAATSPWSWATTPGRRIRPSRDSASCPTSARPT